MNDLEITPLEVKQRLERGEKLLVVDVREPWEHAHCRIENALHIPMGSIPANLQKLDGDEEVICYCHHGMRSRAAAEHFLKEGFRNVWNLEGGIDAWSLKVDQKVPRY